MRKRGNIESESLSISSSFTHSLSISSSFPHSLSISLQPRCQDATIYATLMCLKGKTPQDWSGAMF